MMPLYAVCNPIFCRIFCKMGKISRIKTTYRNKKHLILIQAAVKINVDSVIFNGRNKGN